MNRDLSRLLRPKSIAVIGGGAWCSNVVKQARGLGFGGPLWPVHPSKTTIAGEPACRSVADLPAPPDASFIGINARATIDTVAALSVRGAGGAVCFASGFAETGRRALQHLLLTAPADMPVLGPNCYGFINALDGALLWPDQHGLRPTKSGVAIITQSSNIAINLTMARRGVPIGYMVTIGNQAQTGFATLGGALLADPRVTALGLHIEGIGDIRALEALSAQARTLCKPIIALKVGRSQSARAATLSHTASLAGSDAGAGALLERLNIAQVHSLPEFLETLKLLHVTGPLPSTRLASMSCSGGEAALIADLATRQKVKFPPLNKAQKTGLRVVLAPHVKLANPLDYHTDIWTDADAMTAAFSAMMRADLALGLLVSDFPRADRCDPAAWDCVTDAVIRTNRSVKPAMAVVATLPENLPEDVAQTLIRSGVAPLCGLAEALTAARAAARLGKPAPHAAPVLLALRPRNLRTLSEAQAKSALAAHGLNVPRARRAASPSDLAGQAAQLSFPLVLKGEGFAHKTEAAAVALSLQDIDAVIRAARAMPAKTFLLEEMIAAPVAELLIGVVLDEAHGYVLTFGAGGRLAELIDDTASLLIPASRRAMKAALRTLKIHRLLAGHRGRPPADINAIIDAACALQSYVRQNHG
ncbi:MAG: acetate--CoA ligase family protein, partial [Paracoccaceae bacterium]